MTRGERNDALLTWCSETGSGSWQMWCEACAALGLEPNEAARNHSALGHVEFDWGDSRFAVAPTALVPIPGLDGQLLLTGARPVGEPERLQKVADREQIELVFAEPVPQRRGDGPATILAEGDLGDADAFAAAAGIEVESSPQLLAASLPALTLELAGERRPPDLRYPHCRVDERTLRPRWDEQDPDGAEGLWLCYGYRRGDHYLRRDGVWWYLPIREHGPFLACAQDVYPPLLEYDQATWLVHTRGRAPLPPLQARVLALCSGRLPLRRLAGDDEQEVSYVNVEPAIALEVARSLSVPLREPAAA
jgi:hypothetical protein